MTFITQTKLSPQDIRTLVQKVTSGAVDTATKLMILLNWNLYVYIDMIVLTKRDWSLCGSRIYPQTLLYLGLVTPILAFTITKAPPSDPNLFIILSNDHMTPSGHSRSIAILQSKVQPCHPTHLGKNGPVLPDCRWQSILCWYSHVNINI